MVTKTVQKQKKYWFKRLVAELRRLIETLEYDTIHVKHTVGKKILPLYHEGKIQRGTIKKIAEEIGWSRREVHRCIRFARKYRTPQDAIEELRHICHTLTWYNVCEFLLPNETATPPLPEGSFEIIYADPPWNYEFSMSERGDPKESYDTMSVDEICALKIPASENAVLFLWATNPKLEEALKVIKAWGFQYRTNLVWVKDRFGTGYYFRGQHELLLVAKKGDTQAPNESNRFPSVLFAPCKEHSRKPLEVYDLIEKMFPNQKYLELFARNRRRGWVAWGNEVDA